MTNEAFIWADELVSEFINWRSGLSKPILDRISVFKESKQPKQTLANEELEDKWVKANATFDGKKMNETNFKIASEQPKSQPIKSNIEHLYPKVEKVEQKQPTKLYTEEQMKECFHESGAMEWMGNCIRRKYPTFEDYKKQKLNQ